MLRGASSSAATRGNTCTHERAAAGAVTKNKNNSNHKNCAGSSSRRFSDEQLKSLESMFKKENKLEPRKKLEMARELGLHPRQVAIWFQNRRARWKSKQVEQDYTNLKADYDSLSHRFESLKKEKHDLLQQLSNLCSQVQVQVQVHEGSKDLDSGSENGGPLEQGMAIYSDEDDPNRKEDTNMGVGVSEEIRHENNCIFDQSCSNWWDIWS